MLNNRLCEYLEEHNMICPEQSGFRKKHRTTDHMFMLNKLMSKYRKENKPLYIAFIYFKQAFDTIRHQDLFYKLLRSGISNKFYNIIKSMYENITLVVQSCDGTTISPSFISHLGIRQGDNLSRTLCNMFVNAIPNICNEFCDSVEIGNVHKLHDVCR